MTTNELIDKELERLHIQYAGMVNGPNKDKVMDTIFKIIETLGRQNEQD